MRDGAQATLHIEAVGAPAGSRVLISPKKRSGSLLDGRAGAHQYRAV